MGNCKSVSTKNGTKRKLTLAVLGLDNAGKTVTAKGLLGVSADSVTPTIGFSSVTFRYDKHDIVLFDLGGGKNIRGIWKNYFAEIYGLIFVIDASEPKRLLECKDVLDKLLESELIRGKPLLLLANKQDVKGALDESDICDQLQLEELVNTYKTPCRVESCSAIMRNNKKLDSTISVGFQWLVSMICHKWEELNTRITQDMEVKMREEKKEKEARAERVRRSRELREQEESSKGTVRDDDDDDDKDEVDTGNPFKPISQQFKPIDKKKEELPKKSKPKYVDDEDCYPSKNVNFETDRSSHRSIAEKPKVEELSLSQRNSRRKTSDPPVSDEDEELIPSGKSYGSKPVARIVTPPIPVRRLQPEPVENFDSYSRSQVLAPITQEKEKKKKKKKHARFNQTSPSMSDDEPQVGYLGSPKPPLAPITRPKSSSKRPSLSPTLERPEEKESEFSHKWNLLELPEAEDDDSSSYNESHKKHSSRRSRPNSEYYDDDLVT